MSTQILPAQANELFHYLFEQASLGIAVEDLEGKLLLVNPALCSMLGYGENELCGMNCCEFANPEDSQDDWALFRIRLSNAPVVRLHLVLNWVDERSGISTEASESGRGGEAGCGA